MGKKAKSKRKSKSKDKKSKKQEKLKKKSKGKDKSKSKDKVKSKSKPKIKSKSRAKKNKRKGNKGTPVVPKPKQKDKVKSKNKLVRKGKQDLLLTKIHELFDFRQIPWMIERGGVSNPSEFIELLVKLQVSIYELDHYLETVWLIDQAKLTEYWVGIDQALVPFGLGEDARSDLVKQIARYQTHELDLRTPKSPSRFRLRHYYYYKSCDVRLLRRLVDQASTVPSDVKLSDWTDFDLITEVHDDINDLAEDHGLINGNRFLFGLFETGKRSTDKEFRAFIRSIEGSVRGRMKGTLSEGKKHIKQVTLEAIKSTRLLLRQTLSTAPMDDLASAKIFGYRSQIGPKQG